MVKIAVVAALLPQLHEFDSALAEFSESWVWEGPLGWHFA